jgi:RNA polymerase sigma factor (sigma-70 family)
MNDDRDWARHADFLHSVARKLVRGAAQDDVVQETLLAVVEQHPPEGGAFQGWLSTVARRQAGRARRQEIRRRARELACVPFPAFPSVDQVVERIELEERLWAAVSALDEPYRSAIRARFFQGLPPRAIAARDGLPLATVKTHLRRALERLRRALDGAYGGTEREWSHTLAEASSSDGGCMVERTGAPKGWCMAGSAPQDYVSGVEESDEGKPCAYLKAGASPSGFGTLMQTFRAERYRGERVRLSAAVRTKNVPWSALWMRVDGQTKGSPLAFDNMHDRPIKGTTRWKRYEIVLDVPEKGVAVAFGVLQSGEGQTWVREFRLEAVGRDVPVTGGPSDVFPDEPVNLGFEES